MIKQMPLEQLLLLIKLLKAEGVKEYSDNGLSLSFGDHVFAHGGEAAQAGHREAEATRQGTDASPAEVIGPEVLKRLHPNYAKLTGVGRR